MTIKQVSIKDCKSKGSRIWLEDLDTLGWPLGTAYTVVITDDAITVQRDPNGKRAVSAPSKNGVIDLTSKKVQAWAQGSTRADVTITDQSITYERV